MPRSVNPDLKKALLPSEEPLEPTAAERDLELLRRWRDGDAAAGTELLRFYRDGAHGLCVRFGIRDPDAIVEVFQDVVLLLLRELPTLPERIVKSFSGWFSWQIRSAVSQRRRRIGIPTVDIPEHVATPEAPVADSAALREAIEKCAGRLPPAERAVFDLRFVRGLSLKEAAALLASTANAVGQAIFRLSRKMRACLSASGFGEDPPETRA